MFPISFTNESTCEPTVNEWWVVELADDDWRLVCRIDCLLFWNLYYLRLTASIINRVALPNLDTPG